jgi:hypothetical protein
MSKELYKEYVNKWIDADSWAKKEEVNDQFLTGIKTLSDEMEYGECDRCDLYSITNLKFAGFTRAPKKHNINGHEVIAPRYDSDFTPEFWVIDASMDGCVNYLRSTELQQETIFNLVNNGWFDNSKSALAYTKALLGSK